MSHVNVLFEFVGLFPMKNVHMHFPLDCNLAFLSGNKTTANFKVKT